MRRTTLDLPEDLDRLLSDAARRRRTSRSAVIREALTEHLATESDRLPQSLGAGRSGNPSETSANITRAIRAEWRADRE
jgi:Arc/MetJ-type ribon-helix-helix transcriptional regulator